MGFTEAIQTCLRNYAVFNGRAIRSEYWWFFLFQTLVYAAAWMGGTGARTLVGLALMLPALGVTARRLHDLGRSGWWMLIALIPVAGYIFLLIWCAMPGQRYANRFGEDPLFDPVEQF